jgi:hypothetical protein
VQLQTEVREPFAQLDKEPLGLDLSLTTMGSSCRQAYHHAKPWWWPVNITVPRGHEFVNLRLEASFVPLNANWVPATARCSRDCDTDW